MPSSTPGCASSWQRGISICGVDDDQSIYRWRGARWRTCSSSAATSDGAAVPLEQNYRSTGSILEAANALIAHNSGRLGQESLDPRRARRKDPSVRRLQRARRGGLVVQRIRRGPTAAVHARRCHFVPLERAVACAGGGAAVGAHAVRVYGGLRFFERAEIKDALAYLRAHRQPSRRTPHLSAW